MLSFDLCTQAHKCMRLNTHMYIHNTHLPNLHAYTYMRALTLQKKIEMSFKRRNELGFMDPRCVRTPIRALKTPPWGPSLLEGHSLSIFPSFKVLDSMKESLWCLSILLCGETESLRNSAMKRDPLRSAYIKQGRERRFAQSMLSGIRDGKCSQAKHAAAVFGSCSPPWRRPGLSFQSVP